MSKLSSDTHDTSMDFSVSGLVCLLSLTEYRQLYLESRLTPDMARNDAQSWLDRIWRDAGTHTTFANFVLKVLNNCFATLFSDLIYLPQKFSSLVTAVDVESLSQLCKLLYTHAIALDIVALHVKISDLLFHALLFLDSYDCETIGGLKEIALVLS
jgi:mediator of RNA polymerase II transcription subunit 5